MEERAQILETGIPLFFKAQIEIKAPAKKIFDFISNPANHRLMDGSGMVKGVIKGPSKLYLGWDENETWYSLCDQKPSH